MKKRVVVTGVGAITPLGNNVKEFWDRLLAGESGIGKITHFDASEINSQIAGEVKSFSPENFGISKKEAKRMDLYSQYALAAAKMAKEDAGLDDGNYIKERMGVILGTGTGGVETMESQFGVMEKKGAARVSPFLVPMMISNIAAGQVSIYLDALGPNMTVVTACASATNAIGEAFRYIKNGYADTMLTGGTEAPLTKLAVAGFASMKALSTRNDDPKKASRPFDKDRDGFVIAEGAGVLVLESLEHALARNANIYCEISGYGASADGYHITAPSPGGEGAARAIEMALEEADIAKDEVDYINAHGTSTGLNDSGETKAIKKVFGDELARKLSISSTKSMTGHLLGAAGAVEAIAVAKSIENDIVPPTINLENPDPDCDLDYVPNESRKMDVSVALSNSLGFGGHNATILMKKYKES